MVRALLLSTALAWAATAAPAAAQAPQADTVDPSVPTQLPRTAVPHHYALTVTPHADTPDLRRQRRHRPPGDQADDRAGAQCRGPALCPRRPSSRLRAVHRSPRASASTPMRRPRPSLSRATIAPGAYRLDIAYSGKINTQANGLFALDYKNPAGAAKRALFTQFEAADARRFVPSWDEPDYKARWSLAPWFRRARWRSATCPRKAASRSPAASSA